MGRRITSFRATTALGLVLSIGASHAFAQSAQGAGDDGGETVLEEIVILSAEEQLKQMPGVSTVTSEDIQKTPVANDISEIVRKMPGVNLTGTTSTGQRGNQRQIDLRGMGPENTLILIDGKPVLSRNSVRMGSRGERDSRGDSNWVPAEAIERIEVIRGPAAARYGSGAAGGVVNIVTKRPEKFTTTISTHAGVPENSKEGHTVRGNIVTGGPINDYMSFRLIGSYSKTANDDQDINGPIDYSTSERPAAGREGVENRDVRLLVTVAPTDDHVFEVEGGYGIQDNLFAGDSQLGLSSAIPQATVENIDSLIGESTNEMKRATLSLTHRGTYDFGESNSYIQWENTRNWRFTDIGAGRTEGAITADGMSSTTVLDNLTGKSEWNLPLHLGFEQKLTLGTEFRGEWMDDSASIRQAVTNVPGGIPGTDADPDDRDSKINSWMIGLFAEDNIYINDRLTLTPGVRFDYHDYFGSNWSPSLNASYDLTDDITVKAGVARAFKAPNLFQLNPNYVYTTMGNGCPVAYQQTGYGCYIVGNENLEAETSINKEIGINYNNAAGWNAGITYFHNDYKDKIQAGLVPAYEGTRIFRWENVPEAVVSGLEGNLTVPLHETLTWSTNATYMIESENKQTGNRLSLVPDYTVNTWLDWQARENLSLILSATHYGEIEAAQNCQTVVECGSWSENNTQARDSYTLVNISAKWDINEAYRLTAGVNNLFDKRILREGNTNSAGANTFNEPGRTFFVSLSATF